MYNIHNKICQANCYTPRNAIDRREILNQINFRRFYESYFSTLSDPKKGGWTKQPVHCPFHKDKTPSFTVNLETGRYKCFGCGAGGSIFDFVMNKNGIGYNEACNFLSEWAGIVSQPPNRIMNAESHRRKIEKERQREFEKEYHQWELWVIDTCRDQIRGTIRLIRLLQKDDPFSDHLKPLYNRIATLESFQLYFTYSDNAERIRMFKAFQKRMKR